MNNILVLTAFLVCSPVTLSSSAPSSEDTAELEDRMERKLVVEVSAQLSSAMRQFRKDLATLLRKDREETTKSLSEIRNQLRSHEDEMDKKLEEVEDRVSTIRAKEYAKLCWRPWINLNSSFCFYLINARMSWEEANSHCKRLGSRLVTFKNEEEFLGLVTHPTFPRNPVYPSCAWTGIRIENKKLIIPDKVNKYIATIVNKSDGCVVACRFTDQNFIMNSYQCTRAERFVCRKFFV